MGAIGPSGSDDRDTLIERRLKAYTTEGEPYLERLPDRHMVVEVRSNRMPMAASSSPSRRHAVFRGGRGAGACQRDPGKARARPHRGTHRLNSELALAKSTAEDANISKTRFLAAASHDILQPLNAARLYVTSLVERQNGARIRGWSKTSTNRWRRSRKSSARCWIFRGFDAGAMTPAITSFKMADLMRSLEIEFAPSARAKGLELIFVPCSLRSNPTG